MSLVSALLLWGGGRLVLSGKMAVLGAALHLFGPTARESDFAIPAVGLRVAGFVGKGVSVADVAGYLLAEFIDLFEVFWKKGPPASLKGHGFQGALRPPLPAFAAQDSDGIEGRAILML